MVFLLILLPSAARAASLSICFKDVSPDATQIRLYLDGLKAVDAANKDINLLTGVQTQADGSFCTKVSPLPALVKAGTQQSYTLKAANSIGQESAASTALAFRYPNVPGVPSLLSVAASVP